MKKGRRWIGPGVAWERIAQDRQKNHNAWVFLYMHVLGLACFCGFQCWLLKMFRIALCRGLVDRWMVGVGSLGLANINALVL